MLRKRNIIYHYSTIKFQKLILNLNLNLGYWKSLKYIEFVVMTWFVKGISFLFQFTINGWVCVCVLVPLYGPSCCPWFALHEPSHFMSLSFHNVDWLLVVYMDVLLFMTITKPGLLNSFGPHPYIHMHCYPYFVYISCLQTKSLFIVK